MPSNTLILPDDGPPRATLVKRSLLFFKRVYLPSPADVALLNQGEIKEEFAVENRGPIVIHWAERMPFPRVPDFDERYDELLDRLAAARASQSVQVIHASKGVDPLEHLRAAQFAISQRAHLESAIPDYAGGETPFPVPQSFVLSGFEPAPKGQTSRYTIPKSPSPATINGIPLDWQILAYLRAGRTVKYLNAAQRLRAFALADSPSSAALSLSFAGHGFTHFLPPSELATLAISSDERLGLELETILADVPWSEIPAMRKELATRVWKIRDELDLRVHRLATATNVSIEDYRSAIHDIRADHQRHIDAVHEAYDALGFGTLVRASLGAAFGALGALDAIWPEQDWTSLMIKALLGGAAGAATQTAKLHAYRTAKRGRDTHPRLLFSDLTRTVRSHKLALPNPETVSELEGN